MEWRGFGMRLLRAVPRSYLMGAIVVAVLVGGVGFLPLFGAPGYEQSLAAGLVLPITVAIAAAFDGVAGRPGTPLAAIGRGTFAGFVYAGIALAVALLHAARVGICEIAGALLYFALTAGAGAVLGGAWGAVAGEALHAVDRRRGLRRRRLLAVLVAASGPLAGVFVSLWRFYSSPMVFAFDPFVGYFSGVLFDTVIDAGTALLTYRLGTLATLTALALFGSILERRDDRAFGLVLDLRSAATRARGALAFASAAASVSLLLAGVRLGHHSTPESIAKDLGAEKHGVRCDVVYPSTTREQEANLLLKDCDEQVAAVEKVLGTRGPARIRAFFFRDENDKKRLMGAAHTYIAKPWREEVYLQVGGYPHPVLGHELAHVIAGSFGRGPFRIAGDLGGLLPNPGLIEGVAVAASPDDEDLTDAQWARAMMQIGILPPMQRIFSLGFLGDSSAKSYTLAGAFIEWIGTTFKMETVRAWYAGGDIAKLSGKSWPELDAAFREHLATVPLPAEAESFAKAKFTRPGLFGRRCPHVVDALRHEADVCRDAQRWEEAIKLYDEALAKDRVDYASLHARAVVLRKVARLNGSRATDDKDLRALADDPKAPRTWRDRAEDALADADFIDGKLAEAGARYETLAARSLDEDAARTFEVKRLATTDPSARAAVAALLLGDDKHGPDIFVGGVALGIVDHEGSPLGKYLIGRNLVQRGFYEKGEPFLAAAIGAPPTPRIARETLRQRAVAACALGDGEVLATVKATIDSDQDPFKGAAGGRRDATLRLVERCRAHASRQ